MTGKSIVLSLIVLLVAVCSKAPEPGVSNYGYTTDGASTARGEVGKVAGGTPKRFIAVTHRLVVEIAEAELPKAWEATAQLCTSIRCEVISSGINNRTEDSPPSGSLSLRVVPDDLNK